ncbi:hypothetical protein Scep_014900 [Stephania cephalantha]|uniref:Uncharacterized protein n=1 Tax=Stephania cephalantha TaxID=152367 RepID=A0AAP0P0X1_9MAGN
MSTPSLRTSLLDTLIVAMPSEVETYVNVFWLISVLIDEDELFAIDVWYVDWAQYWIHPNSVLDEFDGLHVDGEELRKALAEKFREIKEIGAQLKVAIHNRVREKGQHWEIYFKDFGAAFPLAFFEEIQRFKNTFWSVGRPDKLGISMWIEIRNRVRERGQHWEIYFEDFGAAFPLAFFVASSVVSPTLILYMMRIIEEHKREWRPLQIVVTVRVWISDRGRALERLENRTIKRKSRNKVPPLLFHLVLRGDWPNPASPKRAPVSSSSRNSPKGLDTSYKTCSGLRPRVYKHRTALLDPRTVPNNLQISHSVNGKCCIV